VERSHVRGAAESRDEYLCLLISRRQCRHAPATDVPPSKEIVLCPDPVARSGYETIERGADFTNLGGKRQEICA
jgi:hypothetical protein